MITKCKHCGRFYPKKKDKNKCPECEKQYQSVLAAMIKRFGGVIKRLAGD